MATNCEVIGWVLIDDTKPQMLVRENNGRVHPQPMPAESTFGQQAIQTGAFRRGAPIIDPVTHETVGYEMEQLTNATLASF